MSASTIRSKLLATDEELIAPLASANDFRSFSTGGLASIIGGSGTVFGTTGFQKVTVADLPGAITFDPSFNRGGDVIVLSGNASRYAASINGSTAVLNDGDTSISIPVGSVGTRIVFDDGGRTLAVVGGAATIGGQAITATPTAIGAASDGAPAPAGEVPTATGRTFLASGADVAIGGNQMIYGTSGAEKLTFLGGEVMLDPSFNRGGDTIVFREAPAAVSAYVTGSSVVVITDAGKITIPVGANGTVLDFAGSERLLHYDSATRTVFIGDRAITGATADNPISLGASAGGGTGTSLSIDVGTPSTTETITLQGGVAYSLTDDASKNTNVIIKGFDNDDVLKVTKAGSGDYNFSTGDGDGDAVADDLLISYVSGSTVNLITVLNAVSPSSIVSTYASAKAAVGHDFMSFPDLPAAPAGSTGGTGGTGSTGGTAGTSGTLDVGSGSSAAVIQLAPNTANVLSDNAAQNTNVVLKGFGLDDSIRVTGAHASDYNFSTGDDPHDLEITFSTGSISNIIVIDDVISGLPIINNYASAAAALGHSFMTFA